MEVCQFCGASYARKTSHLAFCDAYKTKRDVDLTKERLHALYHAEMRSLPEIAEITGYTTAVISKAFTRLGVPTRSVKEALPNAQKKSRATNLERYGVAHNFGKDHPSRKDWEERLLREEGIVNVFQRPEIREIVAQTVTRLRFTKPHKMVSDWLNDMGVAHTHEFYIPDTKKIKLYLYDIRIGDTNLLIEVNGDYWHANPSVYKASDLVGMKDSKKTASDVWERDRKKLDFARELGYEVLVLWERDITKTPEAAKANLAAYLKQHNMEVSQDEDQVHPKGQITLFEQV